MQDNSHLPESSLHVYTAGIGQIPYREKLTAARKGCKRMQADAIAELAKLGLAVSQTQLSRWETGRTVPSLQYFFALCAIYHIDDPLAQFSEYHTTLLNDIGLCKVAEYRQDLIASGLYKADPVNGTKLIRLYDLPVSAGTGEFLDGESYEEISDTDLPAGSNYALRISGDSMEPKYHDGQIVYCHKQSTLENGEIGIFILNSKGYCKRLEQNQDGTFLISLNKKYAPIPVRDEDVLVVAGKLTV